MNIEKFDKNTGFITLTLSEKELRAITYLIYKAERNMWFSRQDYRLYADFLATTTIFYHGKIPDFELRLLTELYHKASQKEVKND